jgi:uncharacterized YigZ family protein
MPDASHHVYAFRIGYGNTTIEGMSDDGEPSGTAGPPVLAVLRGTNIGDILIVVTRYFGGTKLGTGGLVRAYSEAARTALSTLPTELKITRLLIGFDCPYPLYELAKRLIKQHEGSIDDEIFGAEVTILAIFQDTKVAAFQSDLTDLANGKITITILSTL